MAQRLLPADRLARTSGYGMWQGGDGYLFRPTNEEQVREVLQLARETGRQVVQRGSGRSYGDANTGQEAIILDMTRMRQILSWDTASGVILAEAGLTLEGLWRACLEDGFWPPVVSGTMFPTLGGALAMNIHGKNNFCTGTLAQHVLEIEVMDSEGQTHRLAAGDALFNAVIGSAGLLGVILRVKLKMKKVESGNLRVLGLDVTSLGEQFRFFEKYEQEADYMVSWVDCFARGPKLGRGEMHIAWYTDQGGQSSLRPDLQDLPDTILGFFPKSVVWRFLRLFNNRLGMRFVNSAKQTASRLLGNGKLKVQSLVQFSFLLDYVPNWRWAYLPGGFIQYQSFVPKDKAEAVFRKQLELQQAAGLESFLGVLKRHRPDPFLLTHALDGYSFAMDFKVTRKNWEAVQRLAHQMNDVVLAAGGRFYFAKDSTLRPQDLSYLGPEARTTFERFRAQMDPKQIFTNALAERVGLIPGHRS